MKKIFLLLVLAGTMTTMMGQHARINIYGAYTFDDGFEVWNDANTYYNGTVKAGLQWGAGLEYLFNKQSSAELLYLHRSTTVPANFKFGTGTQPRSETFDLKHDFIMLSGDGHFGGGGKAEGYAGIMAGVLISNLEAPSLGKSSNNTNFAWGGRVGTNIWLWPKTRNKTTGTDIIGFQGYWWRLLLELVRTNLPY